MSKNNNSLFFNILKTAGPDFKFKEELIQLHSRVLQLDSSINLRRQVEYEYSKLKLEEVKERIDEMQFQNKFFIKRNNDILNSIQKNKIKNIDITSNSKAFYHDLQLKKNEYEQYIESIIPHVVDKFNAELSKNVLLEEKMKELELLQKLQSRNNYYDDMIKENERLEIEIEKLRKKNLEIIKLNKEKEEKFIESRKKLQNKIDEKKFDINEYYQENKNKNINALEELDELNKLNFKKNDSIKSENSSLYDLRKQIIDPQKGKIYINEQTPDGMNTINQNFGNYLLKNDINNINNNISNNKNDKIKEEDLPSGKEINNSNNAYNNMNNINKSKPKESKNEINEKSVNSEFADFEEENM